MWHGRSALPKEILTVIDSSFLSMICVVEKRSFFAERLCSSATPCSLAVRASAMSAPESLEKIVFELGQNGTYFNGLIGWFDQQIAATNGSASLGQSLRAHDGRRSLQQSRHDFKRASMRLCIHSSLSYSFSFARCTSMRVDGTVALSDCAPPLAPSPSVQVLCCRRVTSTLRILWAASPITFTTVQRSSTLSSVRRRMS